MMAWLQSAVKSSIFNYSESVKIMVPRRYSRVLSFRWISTLLVGMGFLQSYYSEEVANSDHTINDFCTVPKVKQDLNQLNNSGVRIGLSF